MHALVLAFSLLLIASVYARDTPQSVRRSFFAAGIVPDVLPSFDPVVLLDVTYTIPSTGQPKPVSPPGRNFTMPEVLNRPVWSVPSANPRMSQETFVVAMVDPDAPTPQTPTSAQIRHFLGGGFKLAGPPLSNGAGTQLVNNTPALSEYRQPSPPNTSDPHRYVFLLYRQPLDFPTTISANISNFNISAFADQVGLGQPLAGNFITVSTNPADLPTERGS